MQCTQTARLKGRQPCRATQGSVDDYALPLTGAAFLGRLKAQLLLRQTLRIAIYDELYFGRLGLS